MSEPVKFYAFHKSEPVKKKELPKIPKRSLRMILLRSWFSVPSLLICLCGFFFAGASFLQALSPFGLAWFAAVSFLDKKRSLPLFFLVGMGYLWFVPQSFHIYATILTAEFACFLFYPVIGSNPRFYLPITVFTAVVVIRGLFLVFSGISDTLLVITLLESILTAGLSVVLYRAAKAWQFINSMERPGRGDILCILVFIGGLLLGMRNVSVYSVSPANVLMCLMILSSALLGGIGGGAAVGALLGVLPSLSAMISPAAIGLYSFSGFMAGVFVKFRRFGVIVGYLLGTVLLSLYLLNTTLLVSAAMETLIASALKLMIPKGVWFRLSEMIKGSDDESVIGLRGEEYAVRRLDETGRRLGELCEQMTSLYKGAEPRPEKNISSILDHISKKICSDCSLSEICWGKDYPDTYRDLMRIFAFADANDGITMKNLPSSFRHKCGHCREMTAAINCLYEFYRKNEYWQRMAADSRTLALDQLGHTRKLMSDLSYNIGSQRALRSALNAKLGNELRKNGVRVDQIYVESVGRGELVLRVKTRHCAGERRCGKEISDAIFRLTGKRYEIADCRCGKRENASCYCRFLAGNSLSLEISSVQLIKEGSAVCGDTGAEWLMSDAKEAMIISDGMGSGLKARKESELTVSLVQKILECGFDRDYAGNLLRHMMLMDRAEDAYATVDLCMVDRIRKEAEFMKLGAGASYLCVPGQGLKVISGERKREEGFGVAMPRIVKEELHRGDVIILASDGVSEASGDGKGAEHWLLPLIEESCEEASKVISERIANKAVLVGGGKVKDDITVTVAKVV
ncbi:MAG: SpoIIE family protein phosphatase [Firmicutes bacterium]|nr:SpoIIE family protein phosphatase [Bacillota bacterium]